MPKVSRSRLIAADRDRVWELVADPHNLPRWWPRTMRVEDVHEGQEGYPRWTAVLGTERGTGVRADYRCTTVVAGERYAWEQEVAGTPFERVLRSSALEVQLGGEGEDTRVTLSIDESLRGLSRLGSPMMRGAARRRLDEALNGLELALVGETS
jgi:uncharacterized protein YndB with AHSA1/START domain